MRKEFIPQLFIGIGETNAFFTLRETYLHIVPGPGAYGNAVVNGVYQGSYEVRSFHHFNLSQDAVEAVEKATACAERMGLELTSTVESIQTELREIKRANAEQMAERQRRLEIQQAEYAAMKAEQIAKQLAMVESGRFANGPYYDKQFTRAPIGYLNWLMDTVNDFTEGSVLKATALMVIKLHSDLRLPKPDPVKVVGEEGKRMNFSVTVTGVRSFVGFYGTTYVTTMVTDNNECLVCFSGAFCPNEGEKIKIKATVKKHDEYKGQAQTVIQRVKEEAVK